MAYEILSGSLKDEYKKRYDEIIPVFMNTSAEHLDTYRFIDDCVNFWGWDNFITIQVKPDLQNRKNNTFEITNIKDCCKNGDLFYNVASQYKDFSFLRSCTRELKQRVFNKFVAENFNDCFVDRAIGIRYDEPKRYKPKDGYIYPIFDDLPTEKSDILKFFRQYDFDLKIPEYLGNCVYCFCKNENKLYKAIQETDKTVLFNTWYEMDKLNKRPSYRNFKKFEHLVKTAKTIPIIDDMFSEKRFTGGCSESCEFYDL